MRAIRRGVDIARMSAAVSRPGVDPRINGTWAIVKELGFDPQQGIFADIQNIPTGETETVYIGATYAGNGFGDWCPIAVNDQVYIEFPKGDPNDGGVVSVRTWNGGDPPPIQFQDTTDPTEPTQDRVIVVKPGQKFRLYVSQGGEVDIFNQTTSLKVQANAILAGSDSAVFLTPAKAIADLQAAILGWTPVANDGGAALKVALATWLATLYTTTILKGT